LSAPPARRLPPAPPRPPTSTPFPSTTLFRSAATGRAASTPSSNAAVSPVVNVDHSMAANVSNMHSLLSFVSLGKHQKFTIRRTRSEEHTSELQSRENLVCRLLLEKKNHKAKE